MTLVKTETFYEIEVFSIDLYRVRVKIRDKNEREYTS